MIVLFGRAKGEVFVIYSLELKNQCDRVLSYNLYTGGDLQYEEM